MADYIVTGPDGGKYKVSGDSEEAVHAAVQQLFSTPGAGGGSTPANQPAPASAAAPAKPQTSMWDDIAAAGKTVGGVVDQGVRGVADGVIALPAMAIDALNQPTRLINAGLDAIGFLDRKPKNPGVDGKPQATAKGPRVPILVTGQDLKGIPNALNRATAGLFGVEPPREKPDGIAEQFAHRVGEEVGAMAIPVGAAVRAGKAGVEAARELPAITRMFVEPAAINPGKFVGNNTMLAFGGGAGAATVNEITDKAKNEREGKPVTTGQQVGDILGSLGGAGLTAVGEKLLKAAGTVITAMRGKSNLADEVIRDVTVDEIARVAGLTPNKDGVLDTSKLADEIANGRKVGDTIPGFQESTADRTQNPGLAAMEYARQSAPGSTGVFTARRTANTEAIDTEMNKVAPTETPGALSAELAIERERRLTDAGVHVANATDEANGLARGVQPQGTPAMRGNTIRNELDTAQDRAHANTAEAYRAAGVEGNPLAPTTLAEALDGVTAGLPIARRDLAPQALIDTIAQLPAGQTITVAEASALKTRLLNMRRKAAADPGGADASEVLGRYIDAVEGVIQGSLTAEQRAALGQARTTRVAQGNSFERRGDPVQEILAEQQGGNPRMRDDNVAALSTRDDAMGRILQEADTPATRDAIRNQLLSNADTATAEGVQRFLDRYGQQVDRFPGLRDELTRLQTARGAEATAAQNQTDLIRQLGSADGTVPGRGVVGRYLQYGDENAKKAMTAVLNHKSPAQAADELLNFVNNDPKAVEGARKVFWDIMQDKTRSSGSTTGTMNQVQPYLPAALKKFVDDPAISAVAERLYRDNPEHWTRIKEIAQAMQGVDVRNSAKVPNASGTAQGVNQSYLPTGETLASRVFAVQRGVVSPTFAALNVVGIMARKATRQSQVQAVNTAIDKALLDPDWAAALLKENNPANRAAMRRMTKGWQAKDVTTLFELLAPGGKDEETKDAAMRGAK